MGLLDDAIREHLDLKRRHGADPSEVERQEQEALGPARREAAPPAGDFEAEGEAGAVSAGTLAAEREEPASAPYDDEDDASDDDEPAPSVPAGEPEAPVAPPAPPPEDSADDPAVLDADDVPDLDPEPPPEPELAGEELGDERAGDEREDVLEETPDFLQETPEHDRLWFEQKPPRDFEF
jgi:hypothetical protein